jgi:DNA-binding CsgD family transcriptional regulator
MDPVINPYAPGAGSQPPELAGRDRLQQQVAIAIARLKIGRHAKSVLMVGLRGVGKTVLLDRMKADAEAEGVFTVRAETPQNRSLPALLAPQLRLALLRLSAVDNAKHAAEQGLRALAGFAKAFKVRFHDIEVGIDFAPEPGLADNGDLEADMATLFEAVGRAAKKAGTAVVLFLDEIQYIEETQFAALISALHRCSQANLPITVVGAGLPQIRGLAGEAKSYAERLFDFPTVGPLAEDDARIAILKPAIEEGVTFEEDAVTSLLENTGGYPYFLQEWGKHAWDVAAKSPVTLHDVTLASIQAIAALDESFFRVRFDQLTPKEKQYLRAMAELGPGPHRSGDIAAELHRSVNATATLRQGLIAKGMLFSQSHGDTAFTVPLFDQFMKRIMPGDDWRTA